MHRGKQTAVKQTSAKRSKSVDAKPSKAAKRSAARAEVEVKEVEAAEQTDEEVDDLAFDAEEDEFFDDANFKDFDTRIEFRVFDPEKYETEIHKEIIVVPSAYRKTSEVITKFEFTDVVSNRAKQIENGSPIFVDIKDETDPIVMAEMEIRMKRCPLSVRRLISSNIAEVWDVNEMLIPY